MVNKESMSYLAFNIKGYQILNSYFTLLASTQYNLLACGPQIITYDILV